MRGMGGRRVRVPLAHLSQSSSELGAHEMERSRPEPVALSYRDNRLSEDPRQNFREAVSDRGSGVRSRGETPARVPGERGIAFMKLTTMTQATVDGVMQGSTSRRLRSPHRAGRTRLFPSASAQAAQRL